MAFNGFQYLSFMFIFSGILSSSCHAIRDIPKLKKLSPFEFMHKLEGYQKGDKAKDIYQLKNYLQKFGYLELNQTHSNYNEFDDALEAAVKTYQTNYHLNSTGRLDAETILAMIAPRCGVPDIIRGTNFMQGMNKVHDSNSSNFHIVSHYTFFVGTPRWPATMTHLTYAFLRNTPSAVIGPVSLAFDEWASVSHFTFSRVRNIRNANLVIGFQRGDHGDGSPFDGPGGTLAHAFAPTNGRLHYDADEQWSIGPIPGFYDLQTVSAHEIGHLLGLGHSADREAIMFPAIESGATKNIHADDIQGIRALYSV